MDEIVVRRGEPVPEQTSGKTVVATLTAGAMAALTQGVLHFTGLDLAADPSINAALELLVSGLVAAAVTGVITYYKRNYVK